VFGGVLGSVFVFKHLSAPDDTERLSHEAALARYGFYLEEVAHECGIDFTHEAPTQLDSRLEHILPIIASARKAASAAFTATTMTAPSPMWPSSWAWPT
jgi:hypothetical protein